MIRLPLTDLLIDNSNDLIWVIDTEFKLVYANRSYLNFIKRATGKEKGLNESVFVEGFGDELTEKWKTYYNRALQGESFETDEHFFNPESKERVYGPISFTPIVEDTNQILSVACQSKDVTGILQHKSHSDQLMDASLDTFCTINEAGDFVFVSTAAETHWGYLPAELIGTPYLDLILEEDVAKTQKVALAIIAGQNIKSFANRYRKKDGTIAYNLWSARWDKDSKLMYCVARDAKEKIQEEELINQSEQRFKALVQEGSDLIAILDSDSTYLYVSPTSIPVLGLAPEEFIGRNAFEFIHPEDVERTAANLQKIRIQNKALVEPFRFQNYKKEWRWVETILTNMLDNPAVNGIVANSRDITDKIEEEQKLKLLEKVINSTTDAIVITEASPLDAPGPVITYVNRAFTKMTGYTAEEALGQNPRFLQGPASNKEVLKKLGEKLRRLESADATVLNYTKAGEEFFVNFAVSPVADQKGNITHLISIQRDVTEQKNLESEKELLSQISLSFSAEEELLPAANRLCGNLHDFGKFDLIELWCPRIELNQIKRIAHHINETSNRTSEDSLNSFEKNEGLPGNVWQNGKQLLWDEKQIHQNFIRKKKAGQLGLKSILGIPLTFKDAVAGVLIIGSKRECAFLRKFSKIILHLEQFIGSEINRKRLENDLKYLYDAIPDILCVSDLNGRILKINKAGCKLLGYEQEEIVGQSFDEFVHQDDKAVFVNEVALLSTETTTFQFENRYITKDGKVLWLSWNCNSAMSDGLIYASAKDITEEKKLRELNVQASILAKIGAWEVDLEKSEVFWSEMVHKLHGTHPSTFTPSLKTGINFYREDYRLLVEKSIENSVSTGEGFDLEAVIVTQNLKEKWVRAIGKVECINGVSKRIFGSFQDITERKEAAEKLTKAFKEKNEILESIGDAFFAVNNDWIVTYWNKQAEHILGKKREEILGKNLWEEYADAIESGFYRQYQKAMSTGETINFEEHYSTLDMWIEVTVYPSENGLSIYFKDITLRKKADIRLAKANERFELVTKATNDTIWDWDIENNVFFQSKNSNRFFGSNAVVKMKANQFREDKFHPDDLEELKESIQNSLNDNQSQRWEKEYRIFNQNDEELSVIDRGIIVRNESGKAIRMVGAMTDLTKQKRLERELFQLSESHKNYAKELERSNEELEQFAFITSHDLQEPLRMITGFMDQLKKKYGNQLDEKAHQYIYFATDGAKRMKQIILDLLLYSRANKHVEEIEEVNLNEIVLDFNQLRRKLILEKSALIISNELPIIKTYRAPVTQILHCLLDNAIKYSRENVSPHIEIISTEKEMEWEFSVKDNGIGVEEPFFDKIFVIFQRLHSGDHFSGNGMGLSIAKRSVEFLGGRIWLRSSLGKGSTFYFTIPKKR